MMSSHDDSEKVTYLDNNATTMQTPETISAMTHWCNRGNPSSSYKSAVISRNMFSTFRTYIATSCGFEPNVYSIIFTSGASESNSMIITSAVRGYLKRTGKKPHIVTSEIEHKSILMCCQQLVDEGLADMTLVKPVTAGPKYGTVDPGDVALAIQANTCIVSIMAANNETGAINDIAAIGRVSHNAGVAFHTDAVQLFGKYLVFPDSQSVDAFSVSFHKLHGPPGVGILVVKNRFIDGYELPALVCGTQNGTLRGGTENLPGIAASFDAMKNVMKDRVKKNKNMRIMRDYIKEKLGKVFMCMNITTYQTRNDSLSRKINEQYKEGKAILVWIGPDDESSLLDNTILVSVLRRGICNIRICSMMEKDGVIVSIGSACNASEASEPSHVVRALGVPGELASNAVRISTSDLTHADDVKKFIIVFSRVITSHDVLLL